MGNTETEFSNRSEELPVRSKKAVLRDLQNDNRVIIPNSNEHPPFLKDRETSFEKFDPNKVSSTKKMSPEYRISPNNRQPSSNNAANGHLVYVRRKSEAELTKTVSRETGNVGTHGLHARQLVQDLTSQTHPKIKEHVVSRFPAFVPLPVASSMHSSGKLSVPPVPGNTAMRLAPTDSNFPTAASVPPLGELNSLHNLHWEERYHQLQTTLRKIDQSDQEEYIQSMYSNLVGPFLTKFRIPTFFLPHTVLISFFGLLMQLVLQSLSSVELNRHAIELEKRTIQLSLEEAKELKFVGVLNVLRKPINSMVPADQE